MLQIVGIAADDVPVVAAGGETDGHGWGMGMGTAYKEQVAGREVEAALVYQSMLRAHRGLPFDEFKWQWQWQQGKVEGEAAEEEEQERLFGVFLEERKAWAVLLQQVQQEQVVAVQEQQRVAPSTVSLPSLVGLRPVNARARGSLVMTANHKLVHDVEQLQHLVEEGRLPRRGAQKMIASIEAVLARHHAHQGRGHAAGSQEASDGSESTVQYMLLSRADFLSIGGWYNSMVYVPPPDVHLWGTVAQLQQLRRIGQRMGSAGGVNVDAAIAGAFLFGAGGVASGGVAAVGSLLPVINPGLDFGRYNDAFAVATQRYNAASSAHPEQQPTSEQRVPPTEQRVPPAIEYIDDFLSPAAMEGLLSFCRDSTLFYDVKPGYLGAYLNEGFSSPLLLKLVAEMRLRFPRIVTEEHVINNMWAYKYDGDMGGIRVHADNADVNFNLWLTPDDANLDPEGGGLIVYRARPPRGPKPSSTGASSPGSNSSLSDSSGSAEGERRDFSEWNQWNRKVGHIGSGLYHDVDCMVWVIVLTVCTHCMY
jgi:hypothetical protein